MATQYMTDKWLEALAAKTPEKRQEWVDSGQRLPGIALLLRNGPGRMTWALRYCSPENGARRRLKIGYYPLMTLKDARAVHRQKAEQLNDDVDPMIVLREKENLPDVSEAMVEFIEHCRSPRPGDGRARVKTWKRYAYVLGVRVQDANLFVEDGGLYTPREWLRRSIDSIDPKMIRRSAARILRDHGDGIANNWQGVVSSMLTHCVRKGWIDRNPVIGLPRPGAKGVNQESLSWAQACDVWRALETKDTPATRLLQLMLLSGQRAETVIYASWEQIEDAWWRIPRVQLKTEQGTHLVYLGTPLAKELLARWREEPLHEHYLFPTKHGGPFKNSNSFYAQILKIRKRSGVDFFKTKLCRPTVGNLMAEVGVDLQHISLALDHAVPGVPRVTREHYVNNAEFRNHIRGAFEPYHAALAEHLGR